jgi:diadenosine tetraphosphate (Ap4A) HIT family hydrolase
VIIDNELCYAIYDGFPVTKDHCLIIPKRHVSDYFSLSQPELKACNDLMVIMRSKIEEHDTAVTAFNVGINSGADAGQTIFHCHIHLIPRRKGDVENPRGGVRHLIPGKGFY